MSSVLARFRSAFVANRKALLWLFVTYIPVGMGAAFVGQWLFHTWAIGFVVAGAYILALMFVWARIVMYIRDPD